MQVTIETLPPLRLASLRHTGPYENCSQAWAKLMPWAASKGLLGPNAHMFGLPYDDPEVTDPEKFRYDACIRVGDSVQSEGEIIVQTIEAGTFATIMHNGSYRELGHTYAKLFGQWFPNSSHTPGDPPSLERYLNNPMNVPESELRTQVCVRILNLK